MLITPVLEAEMDESQGLLVYQPSLLDDFQVSKRPHLKANKTNTNQDRQHLKKEN